MQLLVQSSAAATLSVEKSCPVQSSGSSRQSDTVESTRVWRKRKLILFVISSAKWVLQLAVRDTHLQSLRGSPRCQARRLRMPLLFPTSVIEMRAVEFWLVAGHLKGCSYLDLAYFVIQFEGPILALHWPLNRRNFFLPDYMKFQRVKSYVIRATSSEA